MKAYPEFPLDLGPNGDIVFVPHFEEVRPMPGHRLGPVVKGDKARVVLLDKEAQYAGRKACTAPAKVPPACAQVIKKNC
jgi:hypothetical protein